MLKILKSPPTTNVQYRIRVELTFEKFEQTVVKDDVLKISKSPITTK